MRMFLMMKKIKKLACGHLTLECISVNAHSQQPANLSHDPGSTRDERRETPRLGVSVSGVWCLGVAGC
jgi:hypothetical protein